MAVGLSLEEFNAGEAPKGISLAEFNAEEAEAPPGGGDVLKAGVSLGLKKFAEVGEFVRKGGLPEDFAEGMTPEEFAAEPTIPLLKGATFAAGVPGYKPTQDAIKFWDEAIAESMPQFDPERPLASGARRTTAQALGLLMETPLFVVGGKGAGMAGQALIKGKGLLSNLARRSIASGGAFGGEAFLTGQEPVEVLKAIGTGATVGAAGVAPRGFKTIAEAAALLGAGKLLHNEEITPESFFEVVAVLAELKLLGKIGALPSDARNLVKAVKVAKTRKDIKATDAEVEKVAKVLQTEEGQKVMARAKEVAEKGSAPEPVIPEQKKSTGTSDLEVKLEEYNRARSALLKNDPEVNKVALVERMREITTEIESLARDNVAKNPELLRRSLKSLDTEIESAKTSKDTKELRALKQERRELLEEAKEFLPVDTLATKETLQERLGTKLTAKEAKDLLVTVKAKKAKTEVLEKVRPPEVVQKQRAVDQLRVAISTAETTRTTTGVPGIVPTEVVQKALETIPSNELGAKAFQELSSLGERVLPEGTPIEVAMDVLKILEEVPIKAPAPTKEAGAVDLEKILPKQIVTAIRKAGEPVRNVLEGMEVLKEYRNNLEGLEKTFQEVDNFNAFHATMLSILQIAELNKTIPGFTAPTALTPKPYIELIKSWSNEARKFRKTANDRVREWESLGPEQAKKLGEALLDERLLERELTQEELANYELTAEALLARQKIKKDFIEFLNELEVVSKEDAMRRFDGERLNEELRRIAADVNKLRAKPYFPLSRFGKYAVDVVDAQGKTVDFEQFQSKLPSMNEVGVKLGKAKLAQKYASQIKNKGWKITETYIEDNLKGFHEMPPMLIERLGKELGLEESQMKVLKDIGYKSSPNQSFRKRMLKAKKTPGFSEDAMRSYANYFFHGSSHLARLRYSTQLSNSITEVRASAKALKEAGLDSTSRKKLVDFLEKHFDYIMSPKNEWAGLRAYGFIHYLGFMPKAAFVNLTQVPLVTLPYLAARLSESRLPGVTDLKVMKELVSASRDVSFMTKGKKGKLKSEERDVLDRALEEGVTDQSFATTMAAISQGRFLAKAMSVTKGGRVVRDILGKSTYLFSMAEGFNRRATLLATYRMFRKAGSKHEEAYQEARTAVEKTQFEYASWNRARFMRGRVGANVFLFQQYVQNMLFFAARDKGNLRFLGMLAAVAGVQGMPGMEHVLSLIDKMLSTENKKYDSRKEMRDFFVELDLNPDLLMHGLGRYSFGASFIGDQLGIPIPEVDMSGSLSLGRIIPGLEPLLREGQDFTNQFTETSKDVTGAVFSLPISLWQAAMDDDPRVIKRFERAMPSFLRSPVKAYRMLEEEGVTTRSGAKLADFDVRRPEDAASLILQIGGFRSTKEARAFERLFATKETVAFYAERKEALMHDYAYVVRSGNTQARKEAIDEIKQYNREVPFKGLGISTKDLRQSLKGKARSKALLERGIISKRSVQITREIEAAYPDEELR